MLSQVRLVIGSSLPFTLLESFLQNEVLSEQKSISDIGLKALARNLIKSSKVEAYGPASTPRSVFPFDKNIPLTKSVDLHAASSWSLLFVL